MTLITTVIPHIPPRAGMLARAVASVEAQTHTDREVIVVTDASRQGSHWAIREGVQASHGEWVTLLGDDDWLRPNHHEVLLQAALESGADVVYGWYDIVSAEEEPLGDFQAHLFGKPFDAERERAVPGYLPGGGSLIRGDLLRDIGIPQKGEADYPHAEPHDDHAMYIRLMDAGATFLHVPERLYVWTHWRGNTSGSPSRW